MLGWMKALSEMFGGSKVKCVECGKYYTAPESKCSMMEGSDAEIVNLCGVACFSTYSGKNIR